VPATDEAIPINVLLVGGGVQGLLLLNRLVEAGYSTALVTNSDLGAGQTLHSHGILNSGYPYPTGELRASLKRDWLPFARRTGLQLYGEDHFYVLIPPEPLEKLRQGWNEFGYEHQTVLPDTLPAGFRESERLRADSQTGVVKIEEYTFPKRQLVRILSDPVRDRIIRGEITAFQCAAARDDGPGNRDGKAIAVESVDVRVHASGQTITLRPDWVIAAAGTGTRALVESLVGSPSFEDAALQLGDKKGQWREKILSQLEEVTCRNTHMICVRGPKKVLPAINLLVVELKLMVVTANVNPSHDHVSDNENDLITWYVTPMDPGAEPARDVPDMAEGKVDPQLIAEGVQKLLKVFPALKGRAERPDSGVEFTVYAGYKQDIGEDKNKPVTKRLEGVSNCILTLPSLIPGAFVNARSVLELVGRRLKPGGHQPPVGGAGEGIEIGEVSENTAGVKWMSWGELMQAFPGVDR